MLIEYIDNLLQTSMTIRYKGRSLTVDHLVIDTGLPILSSLPILRHKSGFTLKMETSLCTVLESAEASTLSGSLSIKFN